jgi:hypothetical protein
MIGSEWSRILSERCGIFGLRDQEGMHRFLDAFVRRQKMSEEVAVEFCCQCWDRYLEACPKLSWTWGSAYTFFLSGRWDRAETWPWRPEVLNSGASLGVNKEATGELNLPPEELERINRKAKEAQDQWDRSMGKTIQ